MIDFADLDTDPMASTAVQALAAPADIRAAAHVANGGDATQVTCDKCAGSGRWRGTWKSLPCRPCNGTGKTTVRKNAFIKGQKTKAANLANARAEFTSANAELVAALRSMTEWNTFAASMVEAIETYGALTDRQLAASLSMVAKVAATREAKRAERNAEATTKSGEVGVEAINALFAKAMENGLKRPVFRTERLVVKLAKRHPGTLYVTDSGIGGEYVGKIVNGKFEARREAQPDTLKLLCEIAADPMESAVRYGRSTGVCGCCGRELTDADSVAAGIGPVCATKWGM